MRAMRMLRREHKGQEMSPEVRSSVVTGSLIEGDRKHDLESTGKKSLAKEEGSAIEIATASVGGRSEKEGKVSERPNGAIRTMG